MGSPRRWLAPVEIGGCFAVLPGRLGAMNTLSRILSVIILVAMIGALVTALRSDHIRLGTPGGRCSAPKSRYLLATFEKMKGTNGGSR